MSGVGRTLRKLVGKLVTAEMSAWSLSVSLISAWLQYTSIWEVSFFKNSLYYILLSWHILFPSIFIILLIYFIIEIFQM